MFVKAIMGVRYSLCIYYVLLVIVISQDEYDILVIEVKQRMSVNNKDIIRMHLRYNWLISQKTVRINALCSSKQWLLVMFTYQSFLSTFDDIFLSCFPQVISNSPVSHKSQGMLWLLIEVAQRPVAI